MFRGSIGRTAGVALLGCCLALSTGSASAGEWEWQFTPYLWGTAVDLDVRIDDEPALGARVSFSDLVDSLEGAGSLHFEGRRGKLGFLADLMYVSLGDTIVLDAGNPAGLPPMSTVDTEVDLLITEGAGFYRIAGQADGLDLLFGLRRINVDQQFDFFDPSGAPIDTNRTEPSFTDGMLGLRYIGSFGRKWGYNLRADYAAGNTEGALNLLASLRYGIGKSGRYELVGGVRRLDIELEEIDADGVMTNTEITMSGPFAAFVFRFGSRS